MPAKLEMAVQSKPGSFEAIARAGSSRVRSSALSNRLAASLLLCFVVLGVCCPQAGAQDVRIEHVTVVSPERSSPMPDATVYIHGDRIVSISNATSAATPAADAKRPKSSTAAACTFLLA